jgi:ubiquinone/menaquinone biosynthesis C-methylase UbiE
MEELEMAQQAVISVQPNPAEIYERHFVPPLMVPCAEELLKRVPPRPGERVLDVACGTGIVARRAAPLVGATGSIVGVDINPAMLEVARSLPTATGATITWQVGNGIELPSPDSAFDLVFCQQGLQFMPNRQAAVNEMHRVLAAGGRVGIAVWQGADQQTFFKTFGEIIDRHVGSSVSGLPLSLGSAEELRNLLELAGFTRVSIESVTFTARIPSPDTFVRLSVLGAAAVLPEFGKMDDAAKSDLIDAVRIDSADLIQTYRDGDAIAYPMAANIACAYV